MKNFYRLLLLLMLLCCGSVTMVAQTTYRSFRSYQKDTIGSFGDRLSWQLNMMDWALLSPSLGVEIDMGNIEYAGCMSLYLQGRYQSTSALGFFPDESERWSGRAELRWHRPYHIFSRNRMLDARSYYGAFAEPRMAGLSFGYDFPGFGYTQRHFWQFQVGAGLGYAFKEAEQGSQFCPELRLALVYRNVDIRRKYVLSRRQEKRQELVIQQNRQAEVMADQMIEHYSYATNIYIDVDKWNKDLTFATAINKKEVVAAICQQTGMSLDHARFGGECDSIFPIRKAGDYNITYTFPIAGDDEGKPVNVRFRVELKGRREAEALKAKFIQALQSYHEKKGVPVLYARPSGKPGDTNGIAGHIAWYDVKVLLQRLTGLHVSDEMLQGISYRPMAGILKPVGKDGINQTGRYCIRLVFHPEVELNYENDPTLCQFEVKYRSRR